MIVSSPRFSSDSQEYCGEGSVQTLVSGTIFTIPAGIGGFASFMIVRRPSVGWFVLFSRLSRNLKLQS
ncbi:MAG: hypothetical protein BWY50_02022 [Spirochaetes bacterium ADurb.Bin315]|nr:MAG: hypothetical protein BWY50_02022 [Spirochaetes bacterium ADurb.Bin315]